MRLESRIPPPPRNPFGHPTWAQRVTVLGRGGCVLPPNPPKHGRSSRFALFAFFLGGGAFYTRGRGSFWPCGAIGGARAGLFRQTDKAAARRRRGCWRPDQGRGVGNGGNSGAGWAAPQIGGGTEIALPLWRNPALKIRSDPPPDGWGSGRRHRRTMTAGGHQGRCAKGNGAPPPSASTGI